MMGPTQDQGQIAKSAHRLEMLKKIRTIHLKAVRKGGEVANTPAMLKSETERRARGMKVGFQVPWKPTARARDHPETDCWNSMHPNRSRVSRPPTLLTPAASSTRKLEEVIANPLRETKDKKRIATIMNVLKGQGKEENEGDI